MKKSFLTVLLVLVVCLTLLPTTAFAAEEDFTIVDGVLTEYNGPGGDVVIPEGVNVIGENVFRDRTDLTGMSIPEGVVRIDSGAFQRCTGLTNVVIPNGVKEIRVNVFEDCSSLVDVMIPESVTYVGNRSFEGTPWLAGQGEFVVVNGILIKYWGQDAKVVIPDHVVRIGESAFHSCASLVDVTIPEGVDSIWYGAFMNCVHLTNVTIPESVDFLGEKPFWGTPWQKNLGEFAVVNGTLLAYQGQGGEVVVPDTVTNIGHAAFECCESLTSVVIPVGVTQIGEQAFYDCASLTRVTIPESVTYIGYYAFSGDEDLTIYGKSGSEAERYSAVHGIPFAVLPGTFRGGTMESNSGESVSWAITETGEVTLDTAKLGQEEAVWVACYDEDGRYTGMKQLDAQTSTTQIDPTTPNVKLFWLGMGGKPQSSSAAVWGK